MATNYAAGRAFEYRTRDALLKEGAVYVMRAAGSHGKADLAAFFPDFGQGIPDVFLVQCKRDGRLSAADAAELIEIAVETGTTPMLAKAGPKGRGVVFIDLLTEGA